MLGKLLPSLGDTSWKFFQCQNIGNVNFEDFVDASKVKQPRVFNSMKVHCNLTMQCTQQLIDSGNQNNNYVSSMIQEHNNVTKVSYVSKSILILGDQTNQGRIRGFTDPQAHHTARTPILATYNSCQTPLVVDKPC